MDVQAVCRGISPVDATPCLLEILSLDLICISIAMDSYVAYLLTHLYASALYKDRVPVILIVTTLCRYPFPVVSPIYISIYY